MSWVSHKCTMMVTHLWKVIHILVGTQQRNHWPYVDFGNLELLYHSSRTWVQCGIKHWFNKLHVERGFGHRECPQNSWHHSCLFFTVDSDWLSWPDKVWFISLLTFPKWHLMIFGWSPNCKCCWKELNWVTGRHFVEHNSPPVLHSQRRLKCAEQWQKCQDKCVLSQGECFEGD